MNNEYIQLATENALSTRAGSLVKVKTLDSETIGVLGLCDEKDKGMVFDVLTQKGMKAVLFRLRGPSTLYDSPNRSLEWYHHNRRDITYRLKLLEISK